MLAPWKKNYDKPRQCIKKQRHYFASNDPYNQSFGFSSSHIWMWELDHKEGWALKNWCFSIVMLEKTLESPLGCKRIKPVNPKGDQPWIFTGRSLKLGKIENRMSVLQKVFNFFSGCSEVKVDQSCPTLCDSMDYTIHGILQARILEWVAYPFSSRSFWPRNWTGVSTGKVDSLPTEPSGKPSNC